MSKLAFVNGRILAGKVQLEGHAVLTDGATIGAIVPQAAVPTDCATINLDGMTLVPGFIDVQVNGGGDILFNDDPTVDALRTIAAAHAGYGTTALLPTLISDDLDVIRAGIVAVDAAIAAGVPGIVGIHIEGPFLNVERRGIHDADKIRTLDDAAIATISGLANGVTLVTLAPEQVAMGQIAELTRRGVRVMAGHSNADHAVMLDAFAHGLCGVTHLFNAMAQMTPRQPGVVGAALDHGDCWCGLIVDGQHVHPATMRVAVAAKGGVDRFILVTDAMPPVGGSATTFMINGHRVEIVDNVCKNAAGTLAGSNLDMASAVGNAQQMLGVSFADAVRMASANPARMIGLDGRMGTIAPGLAANFVLIDAAGVAVRTWIDGAEVS